MGLRVTTLNRDIRNQEHEKKTMTSEAALKVEQGELGLIITAYSSNIVKLTVIFR
jgi:hypothetical protein